MEKGLLEVMADVVKTTKNNFLLINALGLKIKQNETNPAILDISCDGEHIDRIVLPVEKPVSKPIGLTYHEAMQEAFIFHKRIRRRDWKNEEAYCVCEIIDGINTLMFYHKAGLGVPYTSTHSFDTEKELNDWETLGELTVNISCVMKSPEPAVEIKEQPEPKMQYSQAREYLRGGENRRVRRKGWHSTSYLYVGENNVLTYVTVHSERVSFTRKKFKINDINSDDWEIVKTTELPYEQAYKFMQRGSEIRRKAWSADQSIYLLRQSQKSNKCVVMFTDGVNNEKFIDMEQMENDITKNDWEIAIN